MLRIYADKHKQRWDQFLQPVLLAYRTSINASTKETPFFLLYGRIPSLPGDRQYREREVGSSFQSYKAEWLHGLREAQAFARISLEKEKMRQESAMAKQRTPYRFSVGQQVENERGFALTQLIHVSRMKEYKGGQNTPTEAPEVDDDFDPSLEEEATLDSTQSRHDKWKKKQEAKMAAKGKTPLQRQAQPKYEMMGQTPMMESGNRQLEKKYLHEQHY
ncbi:hypothetical protein Pelo_19508 [Pelomyxa schiedti]|nr:hypothetical protein Pelo_19508 [Pelomyxa schiedti]